MFRTAKIVIFLLGVLWIMQHYAPKYLPSYLVESGYPEWRSQSRFEEVLHAMAEQLRSFTSKVTNR